MVVGQLGGSGRSRAPARARTRSGWAPSTKNQYKPNSTALTSQNPLQARGEWGSAVHYLRLELGLPPFTARDEIRGGSADSAAGRAPQHPLAFRRLIGRASFRVPPLTLRFSGSGSGVDGGRLRLGSVGWACFGDARSLASLLAAWIGSVAVETRAKLTHWSYSESKPS